MLTIFLFVSVLCFISFVTTGSDTAFTIWAILGITMSIIALIAAGTHATL